MALGDLLAALERDADAEVRAITAAASDDAARIEADAARRCAAELADALRDLTERERARHAAQVAEHELAHRRAVLEARAAMLDRVRARMRELLPGLVDDTLRARFAAAASAFGDGARRDVPTGVVVTLADGTLVEASLEAILASVWPRLAGDALALVGGAP